MAPIDPDALSAVVHTLTLTQEAMPARWSEDTVDERLTLVGITFHEFIAAVLTTPLGDGSPGPDAPLATRAAVHARAIADLLTAVAFAYWEDSGDELSEIGRAEAPPALTARWIEEIAAVCMDDSRRPQHDIAAEYVQSAARWMSLAARIINAEKGFSLNPDDPRGPVEHPDGLATGEDAGGLLIACGAAALCVAAKLQPRFRIHGSEGAVAD